MTAPFPGFPTDLQAQYMALMTQADGHRDDRETIFENRFQHVAELARMGADIRLDGRYGARPRPTPLSGAARDGDRPARLGLPGARRRSPPSGETRVDRIYHLDRGYEAMESKLAALGARVERAARADEGGEPR